MIIKQASPQMIRTACQNYHYSKSVPSVQYGYSMYNDDNEWCGVVCFGSGATPNIGKRYGLCQGEILELVRVALNGKQRCTSQCVAYAMRKLHQENPLVRMLVNYADMDQGHCGIIYQATNWIYEGVTNQNDRCAFLINGTRMHPKTVHSKGWRQSVKWLQENVDPNAEIIRGKGKHKYIYCFDRKLAKKMATRENPYPKRF